ALKRAPHRPHACNKAPGAYGVSISDLWAWWRRAVGRRAEIVSPLRWLRIAIVVASCVVPGLQRASASSAVAPTMCGQAVRASEGSNVLARAIYLPDRLQYLQRTMRTLLQADYLQSLQPLGGLHVVTLGDSIIGNTFGAQFYAEGEAEGT